MQTTGCNSLAVTLCFFFFFFKIKLCLKGSEKSENEVVDIAVKSPKGSCEVISLKVHHDRAK